MYYSELTQKAKKTAYSQFLTKEARDIAEHFLNDAVPQILKNELVIEEKGITIINPRIVGFNNTYSEYKLELDEVEVNVSNYDGFLKEVCKLTEIKMDDLNKIIHVFQEGPLDCTLEKGLEMLNDSSAFLTLQRSWESELEEIAGTTREEYLELLKKVQGVCPTWIGLRELDKYVQNYYKGYRSKEYFENEYIDLMGLEFDEKGEIV